jgi:RHS repeat-associated protein
VSEYTGDYNELLYLRARYYAPGMGRFLTRDTWAGDTSQPMSLNHWNYVHSNPVNYTDPSGHLRWGCLTDNGRIKTAESAVPVSSIDPLNTYTAAGIAVQCLGGDITYPWRDINYSGLGIAQITQKEAETAYGEAIKWIVKGVVQKDENGKPIIRGYGLCTGTYDYRPDDKDWSAEYMRRRIQMVADRCKFCTERDIFIVSALAQNGPGFTIANIDEIKNRYLLDNLIQWPVWYADRSNKSKAEYRSQWRLFYKFAGMLNNDGYFLPPNILNDEIIIWLKNQ